MNKLGYIPPDSCVPDVVAEMDAQLVRYIGCRVSNDGLITPVNEVYVEPSYPVTPTPVPAVEASASSDVEKPLNEGTVTPEASATKFDLMQWIKENPLIAGGAGLLLLFLLTKKKGRR